MKQIQRIKSLLKFTIPIIIGQVGLMLIGVGDIFIAGKYSPEALSAIGVATSIINPVLLFGIGLTMGVSSLLSIKRGEGEDPSKFLKSILIYSLYISLVTMGLIVVIYFAIPFFNLNSEIKPLVERYILFVLWSFPFVYIFQVIKEFQQSVEDVFLSNLLAMVGVFVNLAINYVFVFGKFGVTKMGFDGLAIASIGVRVFLTLSICFTLNWKDIFKQKTHKMFIKEVFVFSFPIALAFVFEVLGFAVVSILIGGMTIAESAANNIVMNIGAVTFMVPLAIGSASGVIIGKAYGSKNIFDIVETLKSISFVSIPYLLVVLVLYFGFPSLLLSLFTGDASVLDWGLKYMFVVAFFQVVDLVQVILTGVLRGMRETKITSILIFISYWVIGIPFGSYLAYSAGYRGTGLWIGLAVALSATSISLLVILRRSLFLMRGAKVIS